jgi:superfamily II DNA or RNA helicase
MIPLQNLKIERVEDGYTVVSTETTEQFEKLKNSLTVYPIMFVEKTSAGGQKIKSPETDHKNAFCVANTYVHAKQAYLPHCLSRKFGIPQEEARVYEEISPEVTIDFDHPQAPVGQREFTHELLDTLSTRKIALAVAETSAGKTVTGVYLISKLGLRALVIVDKVQVALQWVKEFERFTDFREDNGDILCINSKNKKKWAFGEKQPAVTIITIASLRSKLKNGEFDVFPYGTVLYDELDTAGTEMGIKAFYSLVAEYYLGMTATPYRKDGSHDAYMKLFQGCIVKSTARSLNMTFLDLKIKNLPHEHLILQQSAHLHLNNGQDDTGVSEKKDPFTKCVGRLERLSAFIANLVKKQGRLVLGLARFVGMCDRVATILKTKYGLRVLDFSGETKKNLTDYNLLEYDVIVGTPSKFKRGVNIPMLDTIVELTPVGFDEQYYGRTRRLHPDKKSALYCSVQDVGIECLEVLQTSKIRKTHRLAYAKVIGLELGDIA